MYLFSYLFVFITNYLRCNIVNRGRGLKHLRLFANIDVLNTKNERSTSTRFQCFHCCITYFTQNI